MDYRHVGPEGEPQIVHVDQERDYALSSGPRFVEFVRGLGHEDEFDVE